jgi:hypothetical protein
MVSVRSGFGPYDGEGHCEEKEPVATDMISGDASFDEEGFQAVPGEEVHIVPGGPVFPDPSEKGIETFLRKKEMEEGDAGVEFDWETSVRSGEEASSSDPIGFAEKGDLVLPGAHVFEDGVGVDDVERLIGKGKRPTVAGNIGDKRIAGLEGFTGSGTEGRDFFRIRVVSFQVIVTFRIFGGVHPDVENGIVRRWVKEREKLPQFAGATPCGDTSGDVFHENAHSSGHPRRIGV